MKQQLIRDACLADYSQAVKKFESEISPIAAEAPEAKEFAKEMVRRVASIAHAYAKLTNSQKNQTPLMQELSVRLDSIASFQSNEKSTGGVGYNPVAIEKAIEEGNLREQMTLLYHSIWSVLPKAFADPKLCKQLSQNLDFKLNIPLINKVRSESHHKGINDPVIIFFARCEALENFRRGNGRLWIKGKGKQPPPVRVSHVNRLSDRELRNALCDPLAGIDTVNQLSDRELPWEGGDSFFAVNKDSQFYKQASALGNLPLFTGPSGTTEGFLKAAAYLNMEKLWSGTMLALIGWMLPARDHSLHEIREAGSWYQLPYPKGPAAYASVYGAKLAGIKRPGDFLSAEHQRNVFQQIQT